MRKTIRFCDRCKKTFSLTYNERNNRNIKLVDYEDSECDICPECFESLNEWFDSGESEEKDEEEFEAMDMAFCNAKPLPKGHGRLIDASNLLTVTDYDGEIEKTYVLYDEIKNAPTIIEGE